MDLTRLLSRRLIFLWALFFMWFPATTARAEVRLPDVIGDNMVLQRNRAVPIWGQAQPDEHITVALKYNGKSQQVEAVTRYNGRWQVRLAPMPAGGPLQITIRGSNTIVLRNVLVGEVWLCSGQSNMEMPVRAVLNAKQEIASTDYPQLRLFSARKKISDSPKLRYAGRWNRCNSLTVAEYSAAAYFFGRELYRNLKIPIGLIESSMGTSPIESWLSEAAVKADPDYNHFVTRWTSAKTRYPAALKAYRQQIAQRGNGSSTSLKKPEDPRNEPARLFRDMIAPIIPYGIRGVIWYQGESNTAWPGQYARLFPALIRDWREQWRQENMPFVFVQLPNTNTRSDTTKPYTDFSSLGTTPRRRLLLYAGVLSTLAGVICLLLAVRNLNRKSVVTPSRSNSTSSNRAIKFGVCGIVLLACGASAWKLTRSFHRQLEPLTNAWLREVQQQTAKNVSGAGMAVTIDIGDAKRTHPLNKQEVGRRLALVALAKVYDKSLEYSGPAYESMKVENDKIRLRFSHVENGLVDRNSEPLQGFVIAGADRVFYWAQARIEGSEVVVWSEQVPRPVAVRYAWANNPPADLANRAALPAAPFRTDAWPMPKEEE